jgi:DNA (cytosine-5)-methyltransferase 1
LSLGFEQAGFDVRAAIEIDPVHCAVHKFNFPACSVIPRSVQGLTGTEIRRAARIGNAHVDVVFGGPPCQGFSLIGHRSLDDPRNSLVLDFVRIVKELDARAFVFENVKGLTVGRQQKFLHEIVDAFRLAGYGVREKWQVLDAADFGVPQHRERLILLGSKVGESLPEYPAQQTVPADEWTGIGIKGPTCEDALGDLPDADAFDILEESDSAPAIFGRPSAYGEVLRCLTNDAWHYGYVRKWDPTHLTSSARTGHTEISQRRYAETVPGSVEPISRFYKLAPDGLSNTLRAGTDGARGAFTSPRPIHYKHSRCVTVREMARLHGFPDWFRLHATKWHGARQIGNSVPPPLARAVASEVMKSLGERPTKPEREIGLGDVALLAVAMSGAAEHFEVEKPNTRRDRKSGAKKRKQHETEAARIATLGVSVA